MNSKKNISVDYRSPIQGTSLLLILTAHILLGITAKNYPIISTAHAVLTLALAVFWVFSKNSSNRVNAIAAYIVAAEVFWRMTDANIFWEFGKYAVILILLLAVLRQKKAGMVLPALLFLA